MQRMARSNCKMENTEETQTSFLNNNAKLKVRSSFQPPRWKLKYVALLLTFLALVSTSKYNSSSKMKNN